MKSFTKDFFLQREINNSRVLWHYSMHQYFFHKKPGTSSTIYPAYNFFALRQFEINCVTYGFFTIQRRILSFCLGN